MKANAPEKIYLVPFGKPIIEPIPQPENDADTIWSSKPYDSADNIEYTRTDAFIEKACEWLKDNIYHRVYECNDRLGFPTAKFIEDFKNYMKGE